MKLRRQRSARKGRIEIIPMIDVMFFLLATFMLASLSMQSMDAVNVNLPRGRSAALQQKETVTMTVQRDGKVFLDKQPVAIDQLAAVLSNMLPTHGRNLVVAADSLAPEGVVVHAMLQARHAGVEHFMIAVQRQ
jgi:biopolymer transport protein ExbD